MPAKKEFPKKSSTYRISDDTKKRIADLSKVWKKNQTGVVENAIKMAHIKECGQQPIKQQRLQLLR